MDLQIHISLPDWLMATFLYSIYISATLALWGWTLQMLCHHGKHRMGLWVWKAWLGLNIRRDANELSDWVVETMLNDYEKQTGKKYVLQDNGEVEHE